MLRSRHQPQVTRPFPISLYEIKARREEKEEGEETNISEITWVYNNPVLMITTDTNFQITCNQEG